MVHSRRWPSINGEWADRKGGWWGGCYHLMMNQLLEETGRVDAILRDWARWRGIQDWWMVVGGDISSMNEHSRWVEMGHAGMGRVYVPGRSYNELDKTDPVDGVGCWYLAEVSHSDGETGKMDDAVNGIFQKWVVVERGERSYGWWGGWCSSSEPW